MRNLLFLSAACFFMLPGSASLASPDFIITHTYTTPIELEPVSFADLKNSYQTAGVCFIGFGDCGGNTDFGRSDEGFTLPDCASIGYPLTSCTPPGTDAGFVSGCGQGEILDPDGLCPYDAAYGKCVCDPCSGYDYTYEEATEKGYEVDGAACDSCGTKKYKRRNATQRKLFGISGLRLRAGNRLFQLPERNA